MKAEEYVVQLEKGEVKRTTEEVYKEIILYEDKEKIVKETIPNDLEISCFKVSCRPLKTALILRYRDMKRNLKEYLNTTIENMTVGLLDRIDNLEKNIEKQPKDIEELILLEDYLAKVRPEVKKLRAEIAFCMKDYELLDQIGFKLPIENFNRRWELLGGPHRIKELISKRKKRLLEEKSEFEEEMKMKQEFFINNLEDIEVLIKKFSQYQRLQDHAQTSKLVNALYEQLEDLVRQAKKFNHHESLFGISITDYSQSNLSAEGVCSILYTMVYN